MNTSSDNQLVHRTFPVEGMTCAACAVSLESYLGHLLGVESVVVSYPNESVFVRFDEALIEVKRLGEAAKEIGYELILDESAGGKEAGGRGAAPPPQTHTQQTKKNKNQNKCAPPPKQ